MDKKLSSEQRQRVYQAIDETERQIEREMLYSEKFRNHKDIKMWQAHIEKLTEMLG